MSWCIQDFQTKKVISVIVSCAYARMCWRGQGMTSNIASPGSFWSFRVFSTWERERERKRKESQSNIKRGRNKGEREGRTGGKKNYSSRWHVLAQSHCRIPGNFTLGRSRELVCIGYRIIIIKKKTMTNKHACRYLPGTTRTKTHSKVATERHTEQRDNSHCSVAWQIEHSCSNHEQDKLVMLEHVSYSSYTCANSCSPGSSVTCWCVWNPPVKPPTTPQ